MAKLRALGGVLALLLVTLLMSVPVVVGGQSEAAADPGTHEANFVTAINQLRIAQGLNPLIVDRELITASRYWADSMAEVGAISHAPKITAGITQPWLKVGENVGMGGAVTPLMEAFIASPTHYENLIDPLYTHVGVGVVREGNTIFTTHRFMYLADTTESSPAGLSSAQATSTGAPEPNMSELGS